MKIQAQTISGECPLSLPAECYIGDPCYVFPDEHWSAFCEALRADDSAALNLFTVDGHKFLVQGTAHGDGEYPVYQNGIEVETFGVDAGLFSVIPMDVIRAWGAEAEADARRTGVILTIEAPKPGEDEMEIQAGRLGIGRVWIDTDEDPRDDEDDEA